MSHRHWCLVGICLVLATAQVVGQEQSEPDALAQADSSRTESTSPPFPVVIVQADDSAAHDKEREDKSDQHEAADLLAQQQAAGAAERSAFATEGQLGPIWVSVYLGAAAAILSAIALGVTGWTAWRTDRTSRDELRAYISLIPSHCSSFDGAGRCAIRVLVQNDGNTPAKNLRHAARVVLVRNFDGTPKPPGNDVEPTEYDGEQGLTLARGQNIFHKRTGERSFTADEIDGIRSRNIAVGVLVKASYQDVFGKTHFEKIGAVVTADDDTLLKLTSNYLPNDLKIDFARIPNYGEST